MSSHDKSAARRLRLEEEVDEVNEQLDRIGELNIPEVVYCEGNHEQRLERYINTKASELFGIVSVPKLFELKDRGWKFVKYRRDAKVGPARVTHDIGNAGKTALYRLIEAYHASAFIGHTHRMASYYEADLHGRPHHAGMFGWLGDKAQVDYMHRVQCDRFWITGFGIGHIVGPSIWTSCIPIIGDSCVVDGKAYSL